MSDDSKPVVEVLVGVVGLIGAVLVLLGWAQK